jgi:hypothetical protein
VTKVKGNAIQWISPREASYRMSMRVGYVVTPEDIRQLRRYGKIKHILKANDRIDLYSADEIAVLDAPNKRNKIPADQWEQVLSELNEHRKSKLKAKLQTSKQEG